MSRITKEKREGIIRTIGWITNINSFSLYSKTKNNYFKNKKLELNFYLKKIKVAGANYIGFKMQSLWRRFIWG